MKWLKILFIISLSTAGSLALLLVSVNYYLKQSGLAKKPKFTLWTLKATEYSPRYIYWGKSYCKKNPVDCQYDEEHILTLKVEIFTPLNARKVEACKKILFLGDSFTIAPWTPEGGSYASQVSRSYAEEKNTCVHQFRLATGGAGNDQELARFSDVVGKIQPNIVIWQFYQNDFYENIKHALYKVEKNELVKRHTIYNSTFLTGFLNQRVPFLANTTLGNHLMYLGEFADILRFWEIDPKDTESLISYNSQKVQLLIAAMEQLANEHDFKLYTTLAPLECQVVPSQKCDWSPDKIHGTLRQILKENSFYISMEKVSLNQASVLGEFTPNDQNLVSLFNSTEDKNPRGQRHLSIEGNLYFGAELFQNLINSEQQK